MDRLTNTLLARVDRPLFSLFPRQLTLLLNDEGSVVDFPQAAQKSIHFEPILEKIKTEGGVRRLFDLPKDTPLSKLRSSRNQSFYLSTRRHYRFVEAPETFHTLLPIFGLWLSPVAPGRSVGIITTSDLLPNHYELLSASSIYLDDRERIVGFTEGFSDYFRETLKGAPETILNRPVSDFLSPAPSEIQREALAIAPFPGNAPWETLLQADCSQKGWGSRFESIDSADFSRLPEGTRWHPQHPDGSYLTFTLPFASQKNDFRIKVAARSEENETPFIIWGSRRRDTSSPGENGYQLGIDGVNGRVALKKNGYLIKSVPLPSRGGPSLELEAAKVGSCFFLQWGKKKLLEYYDPDFLHREKMYVSLFLRAGYQCELKSLEVKFRPMVQTGDPPHSMVELKDTGKSACLLTRFLSFALANHYPDVAGFRLQDITVLKRRQTELERDYHRQRRESERLSLLVSELKNKEELFLGQSDWAVKTREKAERAAGSTATLLIQGPTGSGKEVLAHFIHQKSRAAKGPFLKIDCSTLPATLLESELFGHERGAFTGAVDQKTGLLERANGGTVFLDEVSNLSTGIQAKLLQFLQDFKIIRVGGTATIELKVRILCASNRELRELVSRGEFREDLYYRMAVIRMDLLPLRERLADLPELAYAFLRRSSRLYGKEITAISSDAFRKMAAHPWPGNVRELKNVIEQAVIFSDGAVIGADQIVLEPPPEAAQAAHGADWRRKIPGDAPALAEALKRHGGSVVKLAREWGVSRRAVYYNLKKSGLHPRPLSRS